MRHEMSRYPYAIFFAFGCSCSNTLTTSIAVLLTNIHACHLCPVGANDSHKNAQFAYLTVFSASASGMGAYILSCFVLKCRSTYQIVAGNPKITPMTSAYM